MRQIANSIIGIWLFSIILTLSPFHSFANKVNYFYTIACFAVIYLSSRSIVRSTPVLGSSILKSNTIRLVWAICSLLLSALAIIVIYQLYTNGEGGLSSNRDLFEQKYTWFNYIFIIIIPTSIMLSLSIHSTEVERRIGKIAWLLCGILLLLSGNRQFSFFSIVYLSFYYMGKSKQPRILMKRLLIGGILIISLAIAFSIARLDKQQKNESNIVAKYMSTLSGTVCTNGFIYNSPLEMVYQLLYTYLGMNHSGFKYSADFFT